MSQESRGLRLITLAISVFCTLWLIIGGGWLLAIGGSAYYLISGIVMAVFTVMLMKKRSCAFYLYSLILLGTAIWAYFESGLDFWALAPRLDIWVLFGIWMILPFVYRQLAAPNRKATSLMVVAIVINLAMVVGAFFGKDPQAIYGNLNVEAPATQPASAGNDWTAYGGTQAGDRYSSLSQINESNVKNLQVAWVYQSGDVKRPDDPGEITNESTPLKVGNLLYTCTAHQILVAIDAATGKEKWRFDPKIKYDPTFQHMTCRGVSYHDFNTATDPQSAPVSPAACSRRIYLPVNDGRLIAVDAESGQLCKDFGNNGELDLQHQQPNAFPGGYEPTSPPVITDKVIVIAGAVTDNYSTREPSGVIRGFDVKTGKLLWAFDPGAKDPNAIPADGQHYTANSPNSWAPSAYDPKLDMVYLPMGVTTPDIWGGNRTPEQEHYASGILALNATTGKEVWFYQTVHHDLWDMDIPAQPSLADITDKDGNKVPVIYVPTKVGNIFVLNRVTGQLVVPAPERPVPQGAAKGDHTSATQPFSELTFRPEAKLTDSKMWGGTMFDQMICRIMFKRLHYNGTFTPPSEQGTLVFPGNLGMFEWGGISVNSGSEFAIANPMQLPFVSKLIPRGPNNPMEPGKNGAGGSGGEAGLQHMYGVPFGVELNPFLSPFGLPCMQPSWGFVSAVNLKTNQIVWKKRIGTIRDSGGPIPLPPITVGTPMLGAPMTTAGNIFFIAATLDDYIRAYSVRDGKLLWQARLPAGGQATPMTYEVDGKQYLVIVAGGHGSFGTKMGDYIVAYKLP
ncbi:glucose/quinate/shikimate family membrane-bound PQQ-dependent dehydrogenase [Tatumella citrea]|uniref:Glucose dehydrogenase n=1 Tax=Tatumella citrea TaxID=53336 RepID=A0A1Y0LBJ0_TATCI|nr:glucose/quinate/shikimate family membrane-bound PQQ-dependent dehydrogenase [Tatumella citrea]ARU95446.1 glucose dehydrogenase [Tatumella citrea]ARU99487.1 glucose dehydrogenase [Tatumella citrea]